jgi:hypothetical protein
MNAYGMADGSSDRSRKEKGPATFAGGANKREVLGKWGSR